MKNKKIEIVYREYIPTDIFTPFQEKFEESHLELRVDKKMYFNASGDAVADIIIYISQTTAEAIVQGILISAIYDSLKYSIKTSWTAFKNYFQTKPKTKFDESENRRISLNFQIDVNKSIEYNLSGDISDEVIIDLTDKIFTSLKDQKKTNEYYSNPDFVETPSKPRIRLNYNLSTKTWEPINFGEVKRYLEDIKKQTEKFDG